MIRRRAVIAALALLTAVGMGAAHGQESRTTSLTNQDVLDLHKAGLSAPVVIAKIKASACNFDTSPTALKQLKAEGIPEDVILAMVEAPARSQSTKEGISTQPSATSEGRSVPVVERYVSCSAGAWEMDLRASPPENFSAVGKVACGEKVSVLGQKGGFYKLQTQSGVEGYLSRWFLQEETPSRARVSTFLPPNTVRALGYRVYPQQSTTYLRMGEYSSQTSCYGSGTWRSLGSMGSLNMNSDCSTTYSTPTDIPFTWQFADVYNLIETSSHQYLVHCRAIWRWSKCSPLIPGEVFEIEQKGNTIWVVGSRDGRKQVKIKFDILQASPL